MSPEQPPPNAEPVSPETPLASESPAPPAPEHYPFWGYGDLVLLIGMALPSFLFTALLVRGVPLVLALHATPRVVELLAAQFLFYLVLSAFLLLLFRVRYDKPFWRSLAWTPSRIPLMWIVIAGFVTAFLVVMASSLIHTPETPNPMTELMEGRSSMILMAIFGVTLGPLFEELGFRGFLQPLLVRSFGVAPGILLAAIPFGLLHWQEYGNSWRHVVVIAAAGAAFGWMRHVTGSTRAAVIMHASYNGLFFLALLRKELPHGW